PSVSDVTFAGIFATHRNGTQFTANFDQFSVSESLPSIETDILTFTLPEQTGEAIIDAVNHTVDIEVAAGTDLATLSPVITLSDGAQVSPASEIPTDFSAGPV
ncbi:hypothetical protein, partial [Robiginitalea aurantiaca]|nr:hypothetical protein [Robiginitalea aurantiaca]